MTGEELYEMYRSQVLALQNCNTDEWSELEQGERDTWEAIARDLSDRIQEASGR